MSENMICGKCGIEIHSSETGLRHYGHFTAHSEQRCVALLQEQLSTLRAQLTQSQAELAEAMEEIERLRAAIDHDVIADVNHFDPRTTHE